MQVNANIDESDVGRMRPGQVVTFRVDAYPNESFRGAVEQVRLQPTTVQNVVTYQTVIQVPNEQLKLKPGMTATVTIEVARKSDVRPAARGGHALPSERRDLRGAQTGAACRGTAWKRRCRDERRRSTCGNCPGRQRAGAARPAGQQGRIASVPSIKSGATTVDSLFGPLPTAETRGMVWLFVDKQLKPVRLRLGTSDGSNIEVVNGGEPPGGRRSRDGRHAAVGGDAGRGRGQRHFEPADGPQAAAPAAVAGPGGGGRGF